MEKVMNNIHALEAKASSSNDDDKGYISFAALMSAYSGLEKVLNELSVDQAKVGSDLVKAQNKQLDIEQAKNDKLLKLQEKYLDKVEGSKTLNKIASIFGGISIATMFIPVVGARIIGVAAAIVDASCKITEKVKYELPAAEITRKIGSVQGDIAAAKGYTGALQKESNYTKEQLGGTLSNLSSISKQLNTATSAIGRSIGYAAQMARQAYNIKG